MKGCTAVRIICLVVIGYLLFGGVVAAAATGAPVQNIPHIDYVQGVIVDIQPMDQIRKAQSIGSAELVDIQLTSGVDSGKTIKTINYKMNRPGFDIHPQVGDRVIVAVSDEATGKTYNLADYDRMPYVYLLLAVMVVTLIAVGGRVGLKSLFVVCFAIFIIVQGMIPLILEYHVNLILITLLISAVIAVVTQVTVSGWNPKTWGAILGTVGGVAVAGSLSLISIKYMHLTGLDNEEAIMLKVTYLAAVDFQEVLFAGIVVGSLGAVMDVAISIASAQYEIKKSCPQYGFRELYKAGINVGRDVMGTMSNTLVLAYLGSALPLVLLLSAQDHVPMLRIMNLNLIATEIARTITGSIGLICSIPLAAVATAFFLRRRE
ncbi:putative secreted protein [Propionispora sp. 2/2-37]|uniref:YibE/F family protein n=1 Tax=Propionispora sp. 2/2-37 TaxID=1677858 RepID=UPI0006BB7FD8|nr:YibE/F family protein [Propionispora sp. 2/2-37]CUH95007.1 putative secreted protein [Propionispora sp. 2/2-37]